MRNKFTLVTALLLSATAVIAQSQRMVLIEEFTQASCPPCAAQNPGFNALLQPNLGTKVVAIKYQTSYPGVDPMNTQTQTWVGPRETLYNINGVPSGLVDGVDIANDCNAYTGAPACLSQAEIDARYAVMSPFTLNLTHTMSADFDSIFITLDITASQNFTSNGTLKAHVAIVEKEIVFEKAPGTNGELEFYDVMRQMLPNGSGTTLVGTWNNGDMQTLTFAVPVPSYIYDLNNLRVVAFIQSEGSKEVHQAAETNPILVPNDAAVIGTSLPITGCATSVTPSITLKNPGANTLTDAVITYTLDAGAPQTVNWTGSLASGASIAYTLPTITTTGGSHTLTVTSSMPNSAVDYNVNNNTRTANFSIFGASVAAPLAQNFTTTTFPYTDWIVVNTDGQDTWERASANSGSLTMNYFNYAVAGEFDDLYIPPMNLSTATQASISFDLAYRYFSSSQGNAYDSMQVAVTTDCGTTWDVLYYSGGQTMATAGGSGSNFIPNSSQWSNKCFDLTPYAGENQVIIRFRGIGYYGNNLYIDNINVTNGLCATSIEELNTVTDFTIYPNPFDANSTISIALATTENLTVEIYTPDGRLISSENKGDMNAGQHNIALDGANLSNGIYFVTLRSASGATTSRKVTIIH